MNTEKLSLTMGKRLKSERERLGLSHEKLRSAILEKYGVEISKDSLINYEVSDEYHTKAYKNNGMRVEYLRYFADFYGVSADWLLGLTDVRTPDSSVRNICQYTGLNENAVKTLGGWADLASMAADMDGLTCTTVLDVLNTLLGAHIPDECVKQDAPVDLFYTLLETMATLRDIHRINYSELPEEERAVLLERNGLQGYSNQTHTWIGVEGFRATQAFHDILAHFLKPPELRK